MSAELTCVKFTIPFVEQQNALCDPHCSLRTIEGRIKEQNKLNNAVNRFNYMTQKKLTDKEFKREFERLRNARRVYENLCTRLVAYTNN